VPPLVRTALRLFDPESRAHYFEAAPRAILCMPMFLRPPLTITCCVEHGRYMYDTSHLGAPSFFIPHPHHPLFCTSAVYRSLAGRSSYYTRVSCTVIRDRVVSFQARVAKLDVTCTLPKTPLQHSRTLYNSNLHNHNNTTNTRRYILLVSFWFAWTFAAYAPISFMHSFIRFNCSFLADSQTTVLGCKLLRLSVSEQEGELKSLLMRNCVE
jgi:hypothetical protein